MKELPRTTWRAARRRDPAAVAPGLCNRANFTTPLEIEREGVMDLYCPETLVAARDVAFDFENDSESKFCLPAGSGRRGGWLHNLATAAGETVPTDNVLGP